MTIMVIVLNNNTSGKFLPPEHFTTVSHYMMAENMNV